MVQYDPYFDLYRVYGNWKCNAYWYVFSESVWEDNQHPMLIKAPNKHILVFEIWQLGGSRWVQTTPTGHGNDLLNMNTPFWELSQIHKKCNPYFINGGGVINRMWWLKCSISQHKHMIQAWLCNSDVLVVANCFINIDINITCLNTI
jgi:hypothetical protein